MQGKRILPGAKRGWLLTCPTSHQLSPRAMPPASVSSHTAPKESSWASQLKCFPAPHPLPLLPTTALQALKRGGPLVELLGHCSTSAGVRGGASSRAVGGGQLVFLSAWGSATGEACVCVLGRGGGSNLAAQAQFRHDPNDLVVQKRPLVPLWTVSFPGSCVLPA